MCLCLLVSCVCSRPRPALETEPIRQSRSIILKNKLLVEGSRKYINYFLQLKHSLHPQSPKQKERTPRTERHHLSWTIKFCFSATGYLKNIKKSSIELSFYRMRVRDQMIISEI